jgi:ATP-dependent helicase/nuclease subunit B
MEPFLDQLARLCRAHPTRSKWVFVPTHAAGRTLGDRLVLAGTDWANLRFVTPLDIALRMGAPFLVERGIDPSEEGLGPALIMRLLLDLPEEGAYFRELAHQPQLALALWSTLRELRLAGVRAAGLADAAFASGDKAAELRALLASYEQFLESNRRGDLATVFEEALAHADWCPIQPRDCWTEQPDVVWSPLERRLIDAMPGERIAPEILAVPGLTVPRRLSDARADRRGPDSAVTFAFLMAPEALRKPQAPSLKSQAASPKPQAPVLFRAGGPEAEVEEVFRRILASGRTLDDVEIACGSTGYATLVWEKACRYDWPITLATGLPATLTRPGRALIGLADWIEDDFAAGLLRRLLQSADVALPEETGLAPAHAARLLVRAQAAWGRETYRRSLGRLAESSRRGATRDDITPEQRDGLLTRADRAGALAAWIDALIEAVPHPGNDGRIDLRQLVNCAQTFVTTHAARRSALDGAAAVRLANAIGELRALGEFRCSLGQGLRFLRERVEGLTVGADRPRPGHLHVSSLAHAAIAGRACVFVVGLEEGRVFPSAFEDPILLDDERARISDRLARSSDRTDEAVHATIGRLAAASASGAEICLSYSCRDVRQFRETYPSWVMLRAFRVLSGNPAASYQELDAFIGPAKSCVPDRPADALSASGWWLHGVTRAGAAGRAAVLRQYPSLAAGVRAAEARASDAFTEFDGHVPEAGKALDPCLASAVVSPTQLEGAAECPFRHFLRRGLGVDAIESGERDRDVWLDPLIRGSLLHDLYADFLRRCRDANRRADLATDGAWFQEQGRLKLEELAREMPPPSVEVGDRESRDLLADLDLFVRAECDADRSRTPIGLEVAFGKGGDAGTEPLAADDPVLITAGPGLTFRIAGRIDRVDAIAGPGDRIAFEIVDYKTGGYWEASWKGTFAGGRRLQHALYGLAAAELLKRRANAPVVSGAQYYFSSAKGMQERKVIPAQPLAKTAAVLADLREVIASGLFVHAPDEDACKWCDFGHACGRQGGAQAEGKMRDPRLAPYVRLAAHE